MSSLTAKLGDICEIKRGTTITQKNAVEGEIPVVAGGIKPTYFHNTANRTGKTITISGSGANAGYVNFWSVPIFASDCSTVQVFRDDVCVEYIHYFLLSKQEFIYKELRSGAAQPHVYGKDIANIEVNVPNVSIQKKIVAKLDAIFTEIDKAKAAAEINGKNAEDLLISYTSQSFNALKNDYEHIKLGDVCSSVEYGSSAKSEPFGRVPVLRMGNILNGKLDFSDLVFTNNDDEIKKYQLRKGDVLFNRTNSPLHVGKSAAFFSDEPTIFAGYLIRINYDRKRVIPEYLTYYLNSTEIRRYGYSVMSHSVNQANINGSKLKDYPFLCPSIEIQKKIVDAINLIKNESELLIETYTDKIKKLNLYKNKTLKQAFSDELIKE